MYPAHHEPESIYLFSITCISFTIILALRRWTRQVPAINMANVCLACCSSGPHGVWADHNRAGLQPEAGMRQQSGSLGMVRLQAWQHILLHGLHWTLKHQVDHNGLDVLPHGGDIFALHPRTTLRCLITSSWLAQISGSYSATYCITRAGTALSAVD